MSIYKTIVKSNKRVALLLAVVAFLLTAEAATRIYYRMFASRESQFRFSLFADDGLPLATPRYHSHPYLSYALTPRFKDRTGRTHHNSLGFRGPDLLSATNPDHIRVVTLGGSTTYTIKVLDDDKTYPAQLQSLLQALSGESNIEVVNAGVGGYTSWESVVNLAFRVLNLEPDIIVLYHAANDLHARRARHYVGDNVGYRRSWELRCSPALQLLRYSYLCRLVALRLAKLKVPGVEHYTRRNKEMIEDPAVSILKKQPPIYFRRNLRLIINLARSQSAKVVLCTFASNPNFRDHYANTPYYRIGFSEMNGVIREVAASEGITLADVDAAMPRDAELWVDGVHLNARGAQLKAKIIAEAIVNACLMSRTGTIENNNAISGFLPRKSK